MSKLRASLPEDLVQQIINVPIGVARYVSDVQIWSPAIDRNFTVKYAYNLHFCGSSLQDSSWSFLWCLKIHLSFKSSFGWCSKANYCLTNKDHEEN